MTAAKSIVISVVILFCCSGTVGQSFPRITLSEKDVSVTKMLEDIQQQTGFGYLFEQFVIAHNFRCSFSVRDVLLPDLLDSVLGDQPLYFDLSQGLIRIWPGR